MYTIRPVNTALHAHFIHTYYFKTYAVYYGWLCVCLALKRVQLNILRECTASALASAFKPIIYTMHFSALKSILGNLVFVWSAYITQTDTHTRKQTQTQCSNSNNRNSTQREIKLKWKQNRKIIIEKRQQKRQRQTSNERVLYEYEYNKIWNNKYIYKQKKKEKKIKNSIGITHITRPVGTAPKPFHSSKS